MSPEVRRVTAREGYDRWAATYDRTSNPVVAMDDRFTIAALRPRAGERIADVGCGTGRNTASILSSGASCVGLDFSAEMLRIARDRCPAAEFIQADLAHPLPLADEAFDAVLFALVAEHVQDMDLAAKELRRIVRRGGRVVMSVYHPTLAEAGREANFRDGDIEYRLGAIAWTIDDYAQVFERAGLVETTIDEHLADEALIDAVPTAAKYLGRPMLLIMTARRG